MKTNREKRDLAEAEIEAKIEQAERLCQRYVDEYPNCKLTPEETELVNDYLLNIDRRY